MTKNQIKGFGVKMRYGEKNGLEVVYSQKGELIEHPGEKIYLSVDCTLKTYYKREVLRYKNKHLFTRGIMILTNYRLVFVGCNNNLGGNALYYKPNNLQSNQASFFQRSREKGDFRSFFDIPIKEVTGFKVNPIDVRISISSQLGSFRLIVNRGCGVRIKKEYSKNHT